MVKMEQKLVLHASNSILASDIFSTGSTANTKEEAGISLPVLIATLEILSTLLTPRASILSSMNEPVTCPSCTSLGFSPRDHDSTLDSGYVAVSSDSASSRSCTSFRTEQYLQRRCDCEWLWINRATSGRKTRRKPHISLIISGGGLSRVVLLMKLSAGIPRQAYLFLPASQRRL